jgi:heme-degrading monooxygenase HmoA
MRATAGSIQHVVLFRFPRELEPEEEREMFAQVRAWPERIGGFTELRFGRDMTGARTQGHQYLLLEQFPDEEAMKAYLKHPVHLAFADWVHERGSRELAFDYVLGPDTVVLGEAATADTE